MSQLFCPHPWSKLGIWYSNVLERLLVKLYLYKNKVYLCTFLLSKGWRFGSRRQRGNLRQERRSRNNPIFLSIFLFSRNQIQTEVLQHKNSTNDAKETTIEITLKRQPYYFKAKKCIWTFPSSSSSRDHLMSAERQRDNQIKYIYVLFSISPSW